MELCRSCLALAAETVAFSASRQSTSGEYEIDPEGWLTRRAVLVFVNAHPSDLRRERVAR